jgi:hypothetical protein
VDEALTNYAAPQRARPVRDLRMLRQQDQYMLRSKAKMINFHQFV